MYSTSEPFLGAELAYRRARIAHDWGAGRTRHVVGSRRRIRLPRRPSLRWPGRRPRGTAVA